MDNLSNYTICFFFFRSSVLDPATTKKRALKIGEQRYYKNPPSDYLKAEMARTGTINIQHWATINNPQQ